MASMLEMLSNEIMMDLFEYLDAYHLFKAFFNLNSRFNSLLKDHRLCLAINSKYLRANEIIDIEMWQLMMKYLKAITLVKDKHIRMLMSMYKENDLTCLESLTLHRVRIRKEKSAVVKFISNLKSLRTLHVQALDDIHALVLMVMCSNELPELESFECKSDDYETTVLFNWPTPTNIEYLTVDCILYNFRNLLLQTPKLNYLNAKLTNYGTGESLYTDSPLPIMMHLLHLKMDIHFVSYNDLVYIMKAMPHLESVDLSGSSIGKNLDNGHHWKQLFGHLQKFQLKNVQSLTSASSVDAILATFNDGIKGFWSNVTCSIEYDRVRLSAIGRAI